MALDERYRWKFTVVDAMDRERTLGIGVETGMVIESGPTWFKADPDTSDLIAAARIAAGEQARKHGRRPS